jgi:regulator of RNase E activity RraB
MLPTVHKILGTPAPVKVLLRMSTAQRDRLQAAVKKLNDDRSKPGASYTVSKFILDSALDAADKIGVGR